MIYINNWKYNLEHLETVDIRFGCLYVSYNYSKIENNWKTSYNFDSTENSENEKWKLINDNTIIIFHKRTISTNELEKLIKYFFEKYSGKIKYSIYIKFKGCFHPFYGSSNFCNECPCYKYCFEYTKENSKLEKKIEKIKNERNKFLEDHGGLYLCGYCGCSLQSHRECYECSNYYVFGDYINQMIHSEESLMRDSKISSCEEEIKLLHDSFRKKFYTS